MQHFSVKIENTNFYIHKTSGIIKLEEIEDTTLHTHYFPEFHYVFEGMETIKTMDRVLSVNEGYICLIPPLVHHSSISSNVGRVCFNIVTESDTQSPHGADSYSEINKFFSSVKEIIVLKDECISTLMQSYRKISEEATTDFTDCQKALLLLNVLMRILDRINSESRNEAKSQSEPDTETTRKWIIEEFISTNYAMKNGLSELARTLHIGERRTRELVKKLMGADFKELTIMHRMEIAKRLIDEGSYSMEDISRLVGYNSYSGFYVAYKNYVKSKK